MVIFHVIKSFLHFCTLLVRVPIKFIVFIFSVLVPRKDSLWVFHISSADRFADNPKYLYLYCDQQPDVRPVWITTSESVNDELNRNGYESYMASSIYGKYLVLRSKVITGIYGVLLIEYTGWARLVELTHGNYLKTMGHDWDDKEIPLVKKVAVKYLIHPRTTYVTTSRGEPIGRIKSIFGISETNISPVGFPRNDVLFEEIEGSNLGINFDQYSSVVEVAEHKNIVFYTPTWRKNDDHQDGIPLSKIDFPVEKLDELLERTDAHLYISPHPESMFAEETSQYDNVSMLDTGGDIYPFLKHCDVLITDYSGIFYDFLLLERPMLFYAPDLEEYEQSRGFYGDYKSHVPGPVTTSSDEFVTSLAEILQGQDRFQTKRAALRDEFHLHQDGRSSERLYDLLAADDGRV